MAVESIGELVPTKIPGYADAADIQAALRVYHYGSYDYDINEDNATNLVSPSIAYTINDLQTQINNIDAIATTIFTSKGSILTASSASTLTILSVGTNGQVLTANSATASGLQWAAPEVTLTNSITLSNKTLLSPLLTTPKIADGGYISDISGNKILSVQVLSSAVNNIKITNSATLGSPSVSAEGSDTNIDLLLNSKGSGTVKANGLEVLTSNDNISILMQAI
jgi:hypothetical protein